MVSLYNLQIVESCIECSAKTNHNVGVVFENAWRIAMYPVKPLWNATSNNLTPSFQAAVERIFRLYDNDLDYALNDDEMANFQVNCLSACSTMLELMQDNHCCEVLMLCVNFMTFVHSGNRWEMAVPHL